MTLSVYLPRLRGARSASTDLGEVGARLRATGGGINSGEGGMPAVLAARRAAALLGTLLAELRDLLLAGRRLDSSGRRLGTLRRCRSACVAV